jgi:hypothetical protein
MSYMAAEQVSLIPQLDQQSLKLCRLGVGRVWLTCPCAVLQVTLPARFLTTTAHLIAILTIVFDVVRSF